MAPIEHFTLDYTSLNGINLESEMNVENNSESDAVFFSNFTTNFPFLQNTSELLPIDMTFNGGHILAIVLYSLQMIISSVGNIYVFSIILRIRWGGRLSRINLFLLHLTIADLLVTFLMMPLEIGWNATVTWDAGDGMCRLMSFFRVFGLYLSGFVLSCISLDRYFSVVKPLNTADANKRAIKMLVCAWIGSIICSLPQAVIFHVELHPEVRWYEQCVTFNFFPSPRAEMAYNLSGFFFLYLFPLSVITFSYTCILWNMYNISKQRVNDEEVSGSTRNALSRAKTRTLKMTVIIVATFFFCWTPYNIMSLWYWFDKKSAQGVDQHVQKGLFLFACTNSCVNPIIYGIFHFRTWQNSDDVPTTSLRCCRRALERNGSRKRIFWTPNGCCMVECESDDSGENSRDLPHASSSLAGRNNSGNSREEEPIPMGLWDEINSAGNGICVAVPREDISVIGSQQCGSMTDYNYSGASNFIADAGRSECVEMPCIRTVSENV